MEPGPLAMQALSRGLPGTCTGHPGTAALAARARPRAGQRGTERDGDRDSCTEQPANVTGVFAFVFDFGGKRRHKENRNFTYQKGELCRSSSVRGKVEAMRNGHWSKITSTWGRKDVDSLTISDCIVVKAIVND